MLFRMVSLKFKKKMRFKCFPTLITVLCKERVIKLCDIKRVLIFTSRKYEALFSLVRGLLQG